MRKRQTIALYMLLIFIVEYIPTCFAADVSAATKSIDQAERDLNSAYVNVSEADSAGADVSVFLDTLNQAGIYLSEAIASFKTGNYNDAVALAANCSDTVKGVADEASNLKSYAQGVHSNTIFWAVIVSVFGVISVVIFGFLGWGILKRRYSKDLLTKRPEVVN